MAVSRGMLRSPRRRCLLAITALLSAGVLLTPAEAAPAGGESPAVLGSGLPEASAQSRLPDRRSFTSGDRMYVTGDETGRYPASGFHIRGEMGGFWTSALKLLDGIWFSVDNSWLGTGTPARSYTSGWGYERFRYARHNGVSVARTQFVPDGPGVTLIGLTMRAAQPKTVSLSMDAHSELLPAYPWTETKPASQDVDLTDSAALSGSALRFSDRGKAKASSSRRDYTALVGSERKPVGHSVGRGYRGPQEPPVICAAQEQQVQTPRRCDDSAAGKGAGAG